MLLYNIMLPDSTFRTPGLGYVDVRDIARALIAGTKIQGRNRVLLSGEWFQHHEALDFIAREHPELKDRLPTIAPTIQTEGVVDISRAVSILGIPFSRSWKESVRDAVEAIIKVEKEWAEQGVDVETVLKNNGWRTAIPW
jgi:nucleoside-diphosphate-sugar epimerase